MPPAKWKKSTARRQKMARKVDDEKLKSIYNKVKENPGKKAGLVARLLELNRSEVTRSLPALEEKRL
jgi:predicted transcriptional regulator